MVQICIVHRISCIKVFQISPPRILNFSLAKTGEFRKAMLFKERSNALLPEKHCFFGNGEFVYTFFNFLRSAESWNQRKFRTIPFSSSQKHESLKIFSEADGISISSPFLPVATKESTG